MTSQVVGESDFCRNVETAEAAAAEGVVVMVVPS